MKPYLLVFLFFISISAIFFSPLLPTIDNWGLYDWDQHLFYHESPRISILEYGQFPLWNANYCGGNPLLANPQNAFLSPFFVLVLAFGAVIGVKLQIILYLLLGLTGMFLLAKRFQVTTIAASLAAVIFMLSSWQAARIAVGHTTFLPFALMPWAFYFFLKSFENRKWIIATAITLALMFLSGGIYPFYASAIVLGGFAMLTALEKKKLTPLLILIGVFALVFLLSAVKILPVLEFTAGVPAEKDVQLTSLGIIGRGLLHPNQNFNVNDLANGRDLNKPGEAMEKTRFDGKIAWGWHEYSAYVGVLSLLLAGLSILNYKKNWKLLVLAVFFFILSWGETGVLWQIIRNLPLFNSLHGPSRFIIPFVFVLALLAAKALSSIKVPRKNIVSLVLLGLVTAELLFVSLPFLENAFPLTPPDNLQRDNQQFIQFYTSAPYVSQYPNLLQNLGTLNCYERLHLTIRASPQFIDGESYEKFIGNAYLAETQETFNFSYFSPNKIAVDLEEAQINGSATLVVNQNYYKGWQASNGKIKSHNGLLAAEITTADKNIEFKFKPKSFVIGLLISIISFIGAILLLFKPNLFRKILFQPQS